jgi:fatty-acyl-CoA synthase
VVCRPDFRGDITEQELHEHLGQLFATWWLPDRYLFLNELPKTSVGKFDKKAMRQQHVDVGPAVSA